MGRPSKSTERKGGSCTFKKGTLIGEISFLPGKKPNADVVLERGSLVLMWDHEKLRQWISKNPDAAASFQRLMTSDLAAKI